MLKFLQPHLTGWRRSLMWRVFTNAGWASAAAPITIGLGVVQTGLLARLVGPEGIGAIALFGATCAIVGSFFRFNNAQTAIVYVSKALAEGDPVQARHIIRYCYRLDVLTSLLSLVVVAVSSLVVPKLLNLTPDMAWLQIAYGLTLIFQSTYWTSHALLRVTNRFSWTFYEAVFHSVIKLVALIWLFLARAGLSEIVWMLVLLSFLDGGILYILAKKALGVSLVSCPLKNRWWRVPREVWRFQTYGYGNVSIKTAYRNLDIFLLGFMSDPVAVGIYRAATQLTGLLDVPTQALMSSLSPEYSRLWFNGDVRQLKSVVLRSTLGLAAGLCLAAFVMLVCGGTIIKVVFGAGFLSAKQPLLVLVLASVVSLIAGPLNVMLTSIGQARPGVVAGFVGILVQAALLLLLVPANGVNGAAWAKLVGIVAAVLVILPCSIKLLRTIPGLGTASSRP